jgi:hypothetical protein
MKSRRAASLGIFGLVFGLLSTAPRAADTIPTQFTDSEFWKMIGDFSERDGDFSVMSIITSKEVDYQTVIPNLKKAMKPDGVYIGVGPEQNFTYMSAMRSKMGFVIDIRRDNMIEHLMYKALFEISKDRVDFISRLFARRPAGSIAGTNARAIMAAFANSKVDMVLYRDTLRAIEAQLQTTHNFPISSSDIKRIEYLYNTFSRQGVLSFSSNLSFKSPGYTYLINFTRHPEQTVASLPEFIRTIQANNIPDYVRTLNMAR